MTSNIQVENDPKSPSSSTMIDEDDLHIRSLVYNPSLNSLIYINNRHQLAVRSADQLSTLLHRTPSLENDEQGTFELISCHDKCVLISPTHIYVRQLYQGLYFLDSFVSSSTNEQNSIILIELTRSDAQLLVQLCSSFDLNALPHTIQFYEQIKTCLDQQSSSYWHLISFPFDCINATKACFDILRLHKQQIQHNQHLARGTATATSHVPPLPGIVVVGLLLDYLTRSYHQKKSFLLNPDEQIGSTLESSSGTTVQSFMSMGRPTTRERFMFSEATRYRTFTLWPHAAYRWLAPESMAKAGFYYSPLKDNDDRALCFACTVTLVCWEPSDSPWTEHGRHSPNCPFIKGDFTENVPLRSTCAIQPGKNLFDENQSWLIRSNELVLKERFAIFLNNEWLVRAADVSGVLHIKTIVSLKSLIEQLTHTNDDAPSDGDDPSIAIQIYDRLTVKHYPNVELIPMAITMFQWPMVSNEISENFLVICLVHLVQTNRCLLILTSTTNRENLNSLPLPPSSSNDYTIVEQIENKKNEEDEINSLEYLIELNYFSQIPRQAFIYQLSNRKMLILISTDRSIEALILQMDDAPKILVNECVYRSMEETNQIESICSIVLDEDESIMTDDEESIGIDDDEEEEEEEEGEEFDHQFTGVDEDPSMTNRKLSRRQCFLICSKSGHLILYDTNRTNTTIPVGIVANAMSPVDKCVHVRGTETIYAWTKNHAVEKLNIRELFPSYFLADQLVNLPPGKSLKTTTTTNNPSISSPCSFATLRSLATLTSFDSSLATYFFAQVNSSHWIDTLDTSKANVDRRTWRLQQPQTSSSSTNQQTPSIHIFDLQTASPCLLHTVELRFTLNRTHFYQGHLTVTLYRGEQNEVDQKVDFGPLSSSSSLSNDDILAGPYSLMDYVESPTDDQGLIQLCSHELLIHKAKHFRLVLESKISNNGPFPIDIISITLRSTKHQPRLMRLFERSTIDSLAATILTSKNEKKMILALDLLTSIAYTTNGNDTLRREQFKVLLFDPIFLRRTLIRASRTVARRFSTLMMIYLKNENQLESFVEIFLERFTMNELSLLNFQSASALKWFFVLLGQWMKTFQNRIGTKLLQWLMDLAQIIEKTDSRQRQILRTRFGLYADPFDARLFDVNLTTMIECSLRQRNTNSSSSNSSTTTTAPQSARSIAENYYDPRMYSRYGTAGIPLVPSDPEALFAPANMHYAMTKLLPNSLSSSNVYLKPVPGLFEVSPLGYTTHSTSDGTRLERVDMAHLLALRTYEATSAPPPPNVTLSAGPHHLYHPTTAPVPPPPLPPPVSSFGGAVNVYPFSFTTPNINSYYDTLYMSPPTTSSNAVPAAATTTTSTGDLTPTVVSSFPLGTTSFGTNASMTGEVGPPPSWLPHLASKFKDKQGLQKEKLKLIAKKNKAAAAQSSMLKKSSALFSDLFAASSSSSSSSSKNTLFASNHHHPHLTTLSASSTIATGPLSTTNIGNGSSNIEQQPLSTIGDILTQVTHNLTNGQFPPLYQFVIDRLSSGGRSYFVLDFGQSVTLTDILMPACTELASLSLDFWIHSEQIDCQRLFSSTHISTHPLFLHDLQPPVVARYVRVTLIGQTNISVASLRLPVGYFFGQTDAIEQQQQQQPINSFEENENKTKLILIEGIYETLIANYALSRQRLLNLLSSNGEKSIVEKTYRECRNLQMEMNMARRQVERCRRLLKMTTEHQQEDEEENEDDEQRIPTSDYLRLLADLLTSSLTSLSGQQSVSSFVSLEQALSIFNTFAIRHVPTIDMPKRLLQFCSYQTWWPDFVKQCLQRYFVDQSTDQSFSFGTEQQQALFVALIDLCELTLNNSDLSSQFYHRTLATQYANNLLDLLLRSTHNIQAIEWLLLVVHRLADKHLFPSHHYDTTKISAGNIRSDKRWRFLHTSSIIHTPRVSNTMNNYRRKLRKENLLKKATKSAASVSTQTTAAATPSSSVPTTPNLWPNVSDENLFCNRSLCLRVAQTLFRLLNQIEISNELFILICKCLSDISRACQPILILNECATPEQIRCAFSGTSWRQYAFNGLLLDLIENDSPTSDEIFFPLMDNQVDESTNTTDDSTGPWKKKHFPAMKKSSSKKNLLSTILNNKLLFNFKQQIIPMPICSIPLPMNFFFI